MKTNAERMAEGQRKYGSEKQNDLTLREKPTKFSSPAQAWDFADRATPPRMVIMGDDGRFWVVLPVDAEKLIQGGYEAAPR